MKIALIAPPYPLEEVPSPPLGLTYIAAVCEAAGAEGIILDYIVRGYSEAKLIKELRAFGPDIVKTSSLTPWKISREKPVFSGLITKTGQRKKQQNPGNQGIK